MLLDLAFTVWIQPRILSLLGEGFDPDRIKEPNMAEHVRAGRKSGLGIFLMRQIMDEVTYRFREGVPNRLRLVKYLAATTED